MRAYIRFVIPLALGLLSLPFPLLRNFHVESAMLASMVGCFWAGWRALSPAGRKGKDVRAALHILGYLYLYSVPLLVFSVVTGCFSVHGLGFWLLYPIPSVFFGYAVGRLVRIWNIPYGRTAAMTILAAVAVGVFLAEFFSFPQVYFYNHVWGGWPGPIYDESVQLTEGLFFFRALTAFWILLLWFLPSYTKDRPARWIFWLSAVALTLGYTQMAEMGLVAPEPFLRQQLGGAYETPHFSIYYDRRHYTDDEIRIVALEHEFHLDEISRKLELEKPDSNHKIQSFLYGHPWQKKRLVGAKFTSYVPVWLEQDQLHIARQQLAYSLRHELVHVLSKQFGNPPFNASWSIGLVEGVAVALAPEASPNTTIDQIVASEQPFPTAEEMRQALLPFGFYGGRSTVNYTTSGSFVRYLLSEYPPENFKQAYRTGDMESAYGVTFPSLVEGWHRKLSAVAVDSLDRRVARRLFGIPSLFEQACPRVLTDFAYSWDQYERHMAEGDTAEALDRLDMALRHAPQGTGVKAEWTFQNLKAGNVEKVQMMADTQDSSVNLQLLYADAFALSDKGQKATEHLNLAMAQLPPQPDRALEAALATRMNAEQWRQYLSLTYQGELFGADAFDRLYYRTKIRAVEQAIRSEHKELLTIYSKRLLDLPGDTRYFGQYVTLIHWLGYYGQRELAEAWIRKLRSEAARQRYKERLDQEARWLRFVSTKNGSGTYME